MAFARERLTDDGAPVPQPGWSPLPCQKGEFAEEASFRAALATRRATLVPHPAG